MYKMIQVTKGKLAGRCGILLGSNMFGGYDVEVFRFFELKPVRIVLKENEFKDTQLITFE